MEILKLFGVDWRLLIAQLVNFAVVAAVLYWFAVKPLVRMMHQRSREIARGLDDAKQAVQRLDAVEQEVKDKLQQTKQAAARILAQAKANADAAREQHLEQTKKEVEALISRAKTQIGNEKETMVSAARREVAGLVVTALQKILSSGISKEIDKKYIDKVIKEFK